MPSVSIPAALAAVGSAVASAGAAVGIGGAAAGIGTAAAAGVGAAGLGSAGLAAGTIAGIGSLGAGTAAAGLGTLGYASLGATALSGLTGAYGAYQSGQAQKGAADYNASVQNQNAAISKTNAEIAEQSGEAQAGMAGQKTKSAMAATLASEGASGVGVEGGSFTNVRSSQQALGEIDAMTLRSNAAREAYGYRNKASSESAQATLSTAEGRNAKNAGIMNAASTFLGSAGSASSSYAKFKLAGGFSG